MANRTEIQHLEKKMDQLSHKFDGLRAYVKAKVSFLQWMLGIVISGISVLILKAFFPI